MKTLAFLFLVICSFTASLPAQILEMSPMPERVTNNAVVEGYLDDVPYVYSFAGLDSTKLYSGIHLRSFRYNTQTDTWETIAPLPDDMGKIAAAASRIGDIIYIIGGYHVLSNGSEISSEKVHRYDTQTNQYLSDGAPIPVPIDDQVQAVWRDSLIYVVTGWSNTSNVTNVQIYNPATDQWTPGTPVPGSSTYPSFGASGSICGDSIFYFGGARNGTFSIQRDIRKGIINPNDPSDISWSSSLLDDSGIKAYRAASMSTISMNNVCGIRWIGGSDNTYNYDGIAYNNGQGVDPNHRMLFYFPGYTNNNLYQVQEFEEIPMDLRGIANIGDTVQYICGGMESGQQVSNKTFRMSNFALLVGDTEIENPNQEIYLFPSPATSYLMINLQNSQDCKVEQIRIYNNRGMLQIQVADIDCRQSIDISTLSAGVYYVNAFVEGKNFTKRFVKQN